MCTAQVLLLSREVLMRRCSNTPRGVRRKLFSSADPSGPTEVLKRMQEQIRKRDAERWNFDFFTETPLPGRYQWVPVGEESSCPEKQTTEKASESNSESRLRQAEPIVEEIRRVSPPTQSKRKKDAGVTSQKKITDFMSKRKRLSTDESSSKLKMRKTSHSESLASMARLA